MIRELWNNCKGAFAMYSRIPMPEADWSSMRYLFCFFPCVGLVIALAQAGWWLAAEAVGAGALLRGAVMTALPLILTGGIHLDGYLDTVDALASWREREARLKILKDPHVGAFAVIRGGLWMILYLGGAAELAGRELGAWTMGFVLSRALSGLAVLYFPSANPEGSAASLGAMANRRVCGAVLVACAAAAAAVSCVCTPVPGGLMTAGSLLFLGFFHRMSVRYFGGITGDLAGYFLSSCELLQVLILAAAGWFF